MKTHLFPELQESLRVEEFSSKESKLIRVLDFAGIEKHIVNRTSSNTPKSGEQIARAFFAKSIYNFQTTRGLIDRLHIEQLKKLMRSLLGSI